MIRGIGVDTVSSVEMNELLGRITNGAVKRMFTAEELTASHGAKDSAEYLATRFAVKEAVFKAVAPLLEEKFFDLRMVETLNCEDGSPYVNTNNELGKVLKRAGIDRLFVSITTEGALATAFVIAEYLNV